MILRNILISALIAILLAGCGSGPASATPSPTPADILPTQDRGAAQAELATLRANALATLEARPTATAIPTITPGPSPTSAPPPTLAPFTPPTPAPIDIPITASRLATMPEGVESVFGPGALPNGALARLGFGYIQNREISPDGTLLAFGSATGVHVYDLHTMEQLWSAQTRARVLEIDWSPDGRYFAARLFEWPNILIWDGRSGDLEQRLTHINDVSSMAWSPDSSRLATGFGGAVFFAENIWYEGIAVWDIATGARVLYREYEGDQTYQESHEPVDLDWSPDGTLLAAIYAYQSIALIDLETWEETVTFMSGGYQDHVQFSPDGSLLIVDSGYPLSDAPRLDHRALVYSVEDRELLYTLDHGDYVARFSSLSPDGSRLAVQADLWEESQAVVWDLTTGNRLFSILDDELVVSGIVWSADSRSFISSYPTDGQIIEWDATTGEAIWRGFDFDRLAEFASPTYVGKAEDGSILLWDSATGAPRVALRAVVPPVRIAWSPDLSRIAAISNEYSEQPIIVWDVTTGQPVEFLGSTDSLDGWMLSSGEHIDYYPGCMLNTPLVDPTGTYEVSTDSQGEWYETIVNTISLRVAGAPRDNSVTIEDVGSPICTLAFSSDGTRLAVGHWPPDRGILYYITTDIDDAYITIWDVATQQVLYTLYGHTGAVTDMIWSPDGTLLVTASADGTIIIWRVR